MRPIEGVDETPEEGVDEAPQYVLGKTFDASVRLVLDEVSDGEIIFDVLEGSAVLLIYVTCSLLDKTKTCSIVQ